MKILKLVSLLFPLLYVGCGESEEKQVTPIVKKQQNNELNKSDEIEAKELLESFGISIEDEKISFDFNKTSDFLKKMEIEMHGKADALQHKIEKADINFSRDIGINLSDEKVEIDLNQTRKMFQQINILLKEVLLDVNSSKY